ncbi:MAG: antibiotic biosynthesis monooxygenase [Rhodospirillaceae bacterium]|nr:antibiotic biosynthesis monooxygenase [Rhodospirillaceae bacterium]
MFAITVTFHVQPEHIASFDTVMAAQVRNSVEREPGCHRFDVCKDPDDPARTFLYELYTDADAFQDHLASDHYKNFDATVALWLTSKAVEKWTLAHSPVTD